MAADEYEGLSSTFAARCRAADERQRHTADDALPYVDLSLDLKPREWLVPERIPMRNVSSMSGEGAIGKSLLLMQLSGAVVLGKEWIGSTPQKGPALYFNCEEDDDEARRRMEDVADAQPVWLRQDGVPAGERHEQEIGVDHSLARRAEVRSRSSSGVGRTRTEALMVRPKLIVLDTVADTFGGKENDRAQTRQFITMLRGLAIDAGSAVVMSADWHLVSHRPVGKYRLAQQRALQAVFQDRARR
jgi:RecA-family ATPase